MKIPAAMNSPLTLLVLTFSLSFTAPAAMPDSAFRTYPWSDESPTVRIDKKLLPKLPIPAFEKLLNDAGPWPLSEAFIEIFSLTPAEIGQITNALQNALHEYRSMESARCEPIELPEAVQRLLKGRNAAPGDRHFSFRIEPFPDLANEIRASLESSVLAALGPERAASFLRDRSFVDSQLPECNAANGRVKTITFVLPASRPGHVDLCTREETQNLSQRGSQTVRSTFPNDQDRYAPESIRPHLAEWRKSALSVLPQPIAKTAPAKNSARPTTTGPWNESAPFVDMPKSLFDTITPPALTLREEPSPEIMALLGLPATDQAAVKGLYAELKSKFEKIERANFHRLEPGQDHFVIRPFPKESETLHREWTERLSKTIGQTRADLLTGAIRKDRTRFFQVLNDRPFPGFPADNSQSWLNRGTLETTLKFQWEERNGARTLKWNRTIGPLQGSGSTQGEIPKPWQHLLTPEMLGLPSAL